MFDLIVNSEDDWQLSAFKGAFHREIIAPCECNDNKGLTVILDTTFYADIQFDDDVQLSENLILSCKEAQKVAKAKHSLNHDNLDYFYKYWRDGAEDTFLSSIRRTKKTSVVSSVSSRDRCRPAWTTSFCWLATRPWTEVQRNSRVITTAITTALVSTHVLGCRDPRDCVGMFGICASFHRRQS